MQDPWDTPTKKIHPLIDCNVAELTKNAAGVNDLETLTAMRESELANQNRISALDAIDERTKKVKAIVAQAAAGASGKKPDEDVGPAKSNDESPARAEFVTRAGGRFVVEYPNLSAMLITTKVCIAHAKTGRGVVIPYQDGHVMIIDLDHVQLHGTEHLTRDDLIIR